MATTEVSAVLDACVEDVWVVLSSFATMPRVIKRVVACELESSATGPGAIRAVHLEGGAVIRERLLAQDDVRRALSYDIVGASRFPVRSYLAEIQAWPVTSTEQAFVRWAVHFDADASDEPTARQMFETTYGSILEDLAAHIADGRDSLTDSSTTRR